MDVESGKWKVDCGCGCGKWKVARFRISQLQHNSVASTDLAYGTPSHLTTRTATDSGQSGDYVISVNNVVTSILLAPFPRYRESAYWPFFRCQRAATLIRNFGVKP